MLRLFSILLICAMGAVLAWRDRPVAQPPGILTATDPLQKPIKGTAPVFRKERYTLQALAEFVIEARVLARENYRFDVGAELSPVDLALGWGPMSDSTVLNQINIQQRNRFYYWDADVFPIPRRAIERHSANMHLIPASPIVAQQMSAVRPGHIVRLGGYLVEARREDGWQWRSSLTREDTGNGACELIWVETIALR